MKTWRILDMFFAASIALLFAAAWSFGARETSAEALATVRYVASGGCGSASPCYATIQEAVDASDPGDEIRVAAGSYMGVNNQGGLSQAVYIAKSITIRGGFTTANWNTPDPETNVAEINAMTLGRVFYITGTQTIATLEGLHITYGDSIGLGGHSPTVFENYDAGGGIYIYESSVTIDQSTISHNASPSNGYGGGLYLRYGSLELTDTLVEENDAGYGGGAHFSTSDSLLISGSTFRGNRGLATNGAGAGFSAYSDVVVIRDTIVDDNENTVGAPFAGSLNLSSGNFLVETSVISGALNTNGINVGGTGTLRNNTIQSNEYRGLTIGDGTILVTGNEIFNNCPFDGNNGGGVSISGVWEQNITLRNNHIHHNYNANGSSSGAGVYIDAAPYGLVTLTGNLIEYNMAGDGNGLPSHGYGGGVHLTGDNILLESNVIISNTAYGFIWASSQYWGGFGGGVYINDSPVLHNNIIANNMVIGGDNIHFHAPGIYVNGGSPVLIHNTIAQNTGADGVGLYASQDSFTDERSQVQMFNTIIVSHTIGIYAPGEVAENIVIADGVLWSGNLSDTWGTGTFFISHAYTGSPAFADPLAGDYHIQPTSPAIDAGVASEVTHDIDGERRYAAPDLGADEYIPPGLYKFIHLPMMVKG